MVFRNLLLHILIELCRTFPSDLIELLLLLNPLFVDHLSPVNVVNVIICGCDGIVAQEVLNRLGVDELWVVQEGANE